MFDVKKIIEISIIILKIVIPILFCLLILYSSTIRKMYEKSLGKLENKMRKNRKGYFNYFAIEEKLKKKGAYYLFKEDMNPAFYMIVKILFSLVFLITALTFTRNIILLLITALIGFFIFDLLLNIANNSDNTEMLTDLKEMVDILQIQTNAGIHLSESLISCYRAVSNKRLKYELLKLVNNVLLNNDIVNSIDEFNERFDNEYIDVICVMIKQSQDSGFSIQIMQDISKQLAGLQKTINLKKQEKLDRSIQYIELAIFIGLLAVCIYVMGTELINVAIGSI